MLRCSMTLCFTAFLILASSVPAQTPAGFFPFYIPWDDAMPGTANDVSFLNEKPAGKSGRVLVRDGHLALTGTGQRIRFFATNLAGQAAFPQSKADADAIAASLAKRGINLVRLHHLDNSWAIRKGSIWDPKFPDRQHLNPVTLDRLDYLVSRLIAHGIYVNLNLKVSKELTAADGLPADALAALGGADFPLQKRVDHYDARMIQLQKSYARELLTHVNPYLGHSYLDEPAIAIVEVNNENSLISLWPGQPLGSGLEKLPDFFKRELTDQWNVWLKKKYPTDAALLTAWNSGVEPLGASALPAKAAWIAEQHEQTRCAIEAASAGKADALPDITIRVTQQDSTDWHDQVNLTGITLLDHRQYTVSFEARSDSARVSRLGGMLDQAPWSTVGLSERIETSPQWKPFTYSFTASDGVPEHIRIGFIVGGSDVPLQIRNFTVRAGSEPIVLGGESLASGSIDLPLSGKFNQRRDLLDFLVDTDIAYGNDMLQFLRKDLGVRSLLYVTQVQWGSTAGYTREAASDIIDAHGYINHPQFGPGHDWSATDWTIANKSALSELVETGNWVIGDLAKWRQADKPFSVSEFDEPAPSDFAAECVPALAAMAAGQDWDAIYTFCLPEYGGDQQRPQMITGYFDHLNHTAKAAFYPFAAVAFRSAAVPVIEQSDVLSVPEHAYRTLATVEAAWTTAAPKVDTLATRLSVRPDATAPLRNTPATQPAVLALDRKNVILRIVGPAADGLIGFVGGKTATAGALSVTADAGDNNFAAITLHAVDGLPIDRSERALLTIVARAENTDMQWNAARTSVGDQWGHGPEIVRGVRATIDIQRTHNAKVYALDERGNRKAEIAARFTDGKLNFVITPEQATVWYEIAD